MRNYLAAVLPRLANVSARRIGQLTSIVWAACK
jgi:hypothetical protein